jgi:hypothetical protein
VLDFGIMMEETIIRWLEEQVNHYREPAVAQVGEKGGSDGPR